MTTGRLDPRYRPPVSHLRSPSFIVSPDTIQTDAQKKEMAQRADALKEVWIRQARENFSSFMQYCFVDYSTRRPYAQQWFHDEWSEAMDEYKRLLIVAPRNSGKTSQIVGRAIWELGRNTDLRIKIACASDGRAKERLFEVSQNILCNHRVKEVFPGLIPDENAQWNVHKIHVKRDALHKDASVEAVGITSTATGGRCDILIADDVVDRRNALSFPALRHQIKQAWLSDWTNLLEPNSRIWGICTLWHKDDLNHMLMESSVYKTLFYAIGADFGSMWPDKWPEHELRKRHEEIKSVEFNRGFRNQAVDTESQMVPSDWIIFDDLTENEEFQSRVNLMHFFNSYDPAGTPTGKDDQDYSGRCIFAVDDEAEKVYVIDSSHIRLSLKEMAAVVNQDAIRYHPFRIVIEKVGQSSLHEWVVNDYPKLLDIVETATPKVKKAMRLLAITPLMERGQVIFSQHLNPDREGWRPERGSLVHELQDFPFATHDDMVDAFSQGLYWIRRYFLDAWASKGQGDSVEFSIGSFEDDEENPYIY